MRIRTYTAMALFLVFTACAASVDPVLQKRVGEWFAKTSSATYDAGGPFLKVMPYAVGQYVVYGITDGEEKSVYRTAIVGREGDAWVVEMSTLSPTGQTTMQMAVTGLTNVQESMDPDQMDLKWIKMKSGDGEVQKIDGMVLGMMKGTYKKALTGLIVNFQPETGSSAAVRVPAGTFNGCTKATAMVETSMGDFESVGYWHPSVPMNGMVRSTSEEDNTTMELLEFGLSGAKATI